MSRDLGLSERIHRRERKRDTSGEETNLKEERSWDSTFKTDGTTGV